MNQHYSGLDRWLDHVRRETDTRSDPELLEAFLRHADAPAFGLLVERHAPMVLSVCRRWLGNRPEVEDAFQATFLILLRKAASLRWRERLGPWLYGVALRTARQARMQQRLRETRERALDLSSVARPMAAAVDADALTLLDEILARLPEKYRAPLVLCELQGVSRRLAARQLQLPEGTLSSRLGRGRQLLRARLVRRGVTLSGAGLLSLLASEAQAAPAQSLLQTTVRTAEAWRSGGWKNVAGSVWTLTEEVMMRWTLAKVGSVVTSLVVVVAVLALAPFAAAWWQDRMPPQPSAPAQVANPPAPIFPAGAQVAPSDARADIYLVQLSFWEHKPASLPNVLSRPTITTTSGQAAQVQIGQSNPVVVPTARPDQKEIVQVESGLRVTCTPTRLDDERVRFRFRATVDELRKADGWDFSVGGTHVDCQKTLRLGSEETVVLSQDADGKPQRWCKLQVTRAQPGMVPDGASVQPAGVQPVNSLPVTPVVPSPMATASMPALKAATSASRLHLHHRVGIGGARVDLVLGDVRLEATQVRIGSGDTACRIEAAPNGVLVDSATLKTVSTDLVLETGLAGLKKPVDSTKGMLIAEHKIVDDKPMIFFTWGEVQGYCTRLELGQELVLTANKEELHSVRTFPPIVTGKRIEIDLSKRRIDVNGAGSLNLKP